MKKFVFIAIFIAIFYPTALEASEQEGLALIAHAAGAIEGYAGSNSLEAMQNAIELGFTYIELDMITTSDGKIVLNHSWDSVANRIPGAVPGIMTHEEFMQQRIFNRFTPVDLNGLIDFLRENEGFRIITDTKDTDYAALYAIAEFFPQYMDRFIPQVYAFGDAARIRALGFTDIILTIYMIAPRYQNPAAIHRYAMQNELYAVVIPDSLATQAFMQHVNTTQMRYMAHTIDYVSRAAELLNMGFYGVYTGFLRYTETGFARMQLPIAAYSTRILNNLLGLHPNERAITTQAIFFREDVPVHVHMGEILPVWANYLVGAPFIANGQAYLIDRNFLRHANSRNFDQVTRILTVVRNGLAFTASESELIVYNNMLYASPTAIERLFGFTVLQQDGYIIAVRQNSTHSEEELFEIAQKLFSGLFAE